MEKRPDSASSERTATRADASQTNQRSGLFSKFNRSHKRDNTHNVVDEKGVNPELPKTVEHVPLPVGLFEMFRFSTKVEMAMDLIGLVAAVAAGAAQPLMTLITGNVTNAFLEFEIATHNHSSDLDSVTTNFRRIAAQDACYLVYVGLGMLVLTYLYMSVWTYTAEVNARRIRERYLKAVLRQDIAWFDSTGAGEVTTRIQSDTHLVQQGISEKIALCVNFLAASVTAFILAYIRSWRLALALTPIPPCIFIIGHIMSRSIGRYKNYSLAHISESGTIAEEVIGTVRTAHAFGTQNVLAQVYNSYIDKAHQQDLKAAVAHGVGLSGFFFTIYSAYALAFSFGTTLIIHGHADAGIIVNVFMAISIGSFSLVLLAPEMQAISHGCAAAAKLFDTIDRAPPIDSADTGGLKPGSADGAIELSHVNFNYPSRPDVEILRDLSMSFPARKTCAIVGASGSGKSTIIQLLERFYDPRGGKVMLDGLDVKDLNLVWLRSQIGLVSQEPILFASTIKDNILHGLINTPWEHASVEEKFQLVKDACVRSNAEEFIHKLPDGYDTMVGERGFLLSGGQKQRIAIARAVVSDPRILLLDEATSALDTQSEGIVQDALDKAAAGRTTIIIAHRLSTIKGADCIYVLGDGEVLEAGTNDELLANPNGPYSQLVRTQRLRDSVDGMADKEENLVTTAGEGAGISDREEVERVISHGEQPVQEEITITCKLPITISLASSLDKPRKLVPENKSTVKEYSMFYLFSRIAAMQKNVRKTYLLGSFFAVLTGIVYPSFAIVYSFAINAFSEQDHHKLRHDGDRNALWFFVIALFSMWTIGFQNYLFGKAAANLTHKLRTTAFKAILRQDAEFFDQGHNSTGALTSSLSDNPQKINGLAGVTLAAIVQGIGTVVAGSIIGLLFNWKLALVGIACTPILISAGFIRLLVVVHKDQQNKKAHEESAQLACEAAGSVRTIASLTRECDCLRLYSKSLEAPMIRSNKTSLLSNGIYALSQSMSFHIIALVFWFGSRLVAKFEITTTAFFVCLFAVSFSAIQAANVFSYVPDISSAKRAATEIVNLSDARPAIDAESVEGKILEQVTGDIVFEDVHFQYPTRPDAHVLRGLSLTVKAGTYVALAGASGCGKSTAIQLIERFYDPSEGRILVDSQDISEFNVQDYRKHIALVSQEPSLYAGTIRFNILLGAIKPHDEVAQEEIEQACRQANILDFINELPQGFETLVGGKGSQLSGGQKQRIAIARALLRNPKILLLDEATSALDSDSEMIVQNALDQASKGRTTIAIAHRLSTIQNADCIYFIKEGRVSEVGTHDKLLAMKGDYYKYAQLQVLSKQV